MHRAGYDVTDAFERAPHGADVLLKFPVVGELVKQVETGHVR